MKRQPTGTAVSKREEHLRRMQEHRQWMQQKAAEFEEQCRRFWKFMQSAGVRDLTEEETDNRT